jgi:ZIP family zinc transporter
VREVHSLALLLGIAASAATYAGGSIALRFDRKLGGILGLAAGMVVGVALFDLLPEALHLATDRFGSAVVLAVTAFALLGYMFIDRLSEGSAHTESRLRANLAPASLTLHSFIDGTGIGLAFQLSPLAGWLVAIAVVAHDVADGVNTVSLSLSTSNRNIARRWLRINAAAPIAGVLVGGAIPVSASLLGLLLAAFAGIFLYISACHLLPRSHALKPSPMTSVASLAGALFMFAVVRIAQ